MKLTKNREIEHQVSKLLARISKSQSSIDYHQKKLRHHREMKENVGLLKTTVTMIIMSQDAREDYSSDSSESSTDVPCSSQDLRKKNLERSEGAIMISDDETPLNRSPSQSLHLSTILATPNPEHVEQPMSQETPTNLSRLLHRTESPKSPLRTHSCDIPDCNAPQCRFNDFDDEV